MYRKWWKEDFVVLAKEAWHHYKNGSILFYRETKVSWGIFRRKLRGEELTRRERRQLVRYDFQPFLISTELLEICFV
jgi:hypothetical protein